MAPSAVNDAARENMAAIRTWYEDAEWLDFGYTDAYVGATQFKNAGVDTTGQWTVGRRVRAVGSGTGTIYGTITVSAFSTDTTVTVVWDSGNLENEALTVSAHILNVNNPPVFTGYVDGLEISNSGGDADHDLDIAAGNCVDTTKGIKLTLGAALTKQIDDAWAVGDDAGGIDT
jgi:hypothetical protein